MKSWLSSKIGAVALVVAGLVSSSLASQQVFISSTGSVVFGLSASNDTSNADLYFSIAFPAGQDWAAVGLGSQMAGSLILMIYPSASGLNTTFSPRIAHGHSEPEFYAGLDYTMLDGTGLVNSSDLINSTGLASDNILSNGTMYVYNAVCHNCRQWPGGSFDMNDSNQKFIFATGPSSSLQSDSLNANLRMHFEYGTFQLPLSLATSDAGPVVLNRTSPLDARDGSPQLSEKQGMRDWTAAIHGIFMIGCFYGMFPFGVLIVRVGRWARIHGAFQILGLVGFIVGLGLGIKSSTYYNRSKHFNSAHQIIGLVIIVFLLAQLVLGILHHRQYSKTQKPTKFAPIHVWLGRIVIVLGVANAFLGFPLALSPGFNYILAGLVIALAPLMAMIIFTKRFLERRRAQRATERQQDQGNAGYQHAPWDVPFAGEPGHVATAAAPPVYSSAQGSYEMGNVRKNEARVTTTAVVGMEQRPRQFA